jgi:hypothetical protein
MRSALLPLAALTFATPALAAESSAQREIARVADTLNDPSNQAAISGALGAVMAAILDIRVDGIAKALEGMNGGKPVRMNGSTVRELVTRDDPEFERKMQSDTQAAVGAAGGLASAGAAMIPELEKAARRMKEALPKMQ